MATVGHRRGAQHIGRPSWCVVVRNWVGLAVSAGCDFEISEK